MGKKITKLGTTLLAITIFTSCQPIHRTEAGSIQDTLEKGKAILQTVVSFVDIASHWAADQIKLAVSKGYVNGYEDGTFRPDGKVTRAEFAKLVVSAMNLPVTGLTTGSDWYQAYVNAAVSAGVHEWNDYSSGDWNTPMSRQEMARMAVRAVGLDTEDNLEWMYLATKAGLIQGVDNTGSLDVDGTTTRAQAVTIIERILMVKAGRGQEIAAQADKHAVNRAEVLWHKTNIFTVMPEFFGSKLITPWDTKKLVVETPDGLYKGEVEKIIAIDFGDPNDPHRNVLGDIKELKWRPGRNAFNVINYPESYGVVAFVRTDYNYDESKYGNGFGGPIFYINGLIGERQSEMSKTGELLTFSNLVINNIPAIGFIIPKHGQKIRDGYLDIEVSAPAIPPTNSHSRFVLTVRGLEVIE